MTDNLYDEKSIDFRQRELETLEKLALVNKIKELENEKKVKNGSFLCSECFFPVAEYRCRICVSCGLSSGLLTKENGNLKLNSDPEQIEKGNMLCVGCAVEGIHGSHQTVNYQQLKYGSISKEHKKKKDTELAERRDAVVSSQTLGAIARLLQTARVEISQLSEITMNAVSGEEFKLTWNAVDIELARAHSITENFLNVAQSTETSLEKVITGLGAIRTGCKLHTRNPVKQTLPEESLDDHTNHEKGKIPDEAFNVVKKNDRSVSVITDSSEWETMSEAAGKLAENSDA